MNRLASRLLAALALAAGCCAPDIRYPQSPQWHGDHFENPKAWPDRHGLLTLLRAGILRPHARAGFRPPIGATAPALLRDPHRPLSITWIGHSTVLIRSGGVAILTDPVYSRRVLLHTRLAPPGVAFEALPPIDVVVISHNHRDHLDEATVARLGPGVRYVVPLGLAEWFRKRGLHRVIELDWWQSTTVTTRAGRARVTMVPARHWSRRRLCDDDHTLWGGYVIDAGGERIFFAGDSGYPAAFGEIGRRFPGIGYAILPIGAYLPRRLLETVHMDPSEAARAFRELGARALVPVHWGTFALAGEPPDEPPRRLRAAMAGAEAGVVLLPIGGSRFGPPP